MLRFASLARFALITLPLGALPACTTAKEVLGLADADSNESCTLPVDPASLPPLPTNLPAYVEPAVVTPPAGTFVHGVASGDPTTEDVILWTRVTTDASSPATVPVFYEVALDEAFTKRVAAGEVLTDATRDFTVKVDVQGLKWGRDYFYRFHVTGSTSPVGRTRLAPAAGGARCARFAVVSCSSYAHGYFYAYAHIAKRKDVDAVLHLGDYIYEYETGGYGDVRAYEPSNELLTLADYRARYAQYHRDPDLQALHAAHPMVAVWDDHESADNSWSDGANNHTPGTEGDWQARLAAARQAYFEWIPIRDTADRHVWRTFPYGDLADVYVLDTRIDGRDEQVGTSEEDGPERHILGDAQEKWLRDSLATGTARWQIVAQQVMVAQMYMGDYPFNMDQWDGYTGARDRLFDMLEAKDENVVVLTGDIHSSWALELARDPFAETYDPARDNLAVEFVVPAISSPGFPPRSDEVVGKVLDETNPHLVWRNLEQRGYVMLDVSPDRVQADWFLLDGVEKGQGHESFAKGFSTRRGDARLVEAATPVERKTE